jgi:hypothetical protein
MDVATSEDLAFPTLFGGGTAPLSPFQRSLASSRSLPPLLGLLKASCDQGGIPPWNPQHRFSVTMFFFEGIRRSRARGLYEHENIHRTALITAERYPGVNHNEHAEFRRAEKVDEGMA